MLHSERAVGNAARFVLTAILSTLLWMSPGSQWTAHAQEATPEAEKSEAEKAAAEKAAAEKAAAEKAAAEKAAADKAAAEKAAADKAEAEKAAAAQTSASGVTLVVDAYREGKEFVGKAPKDAKKVREYCANEKTRQDKDCLERRTARLNEIIYLKVVNLDRLLDKSKCVDAAEKPVSDCTPESIVLFLNGRPMRGLMPESGAPAVGSSSAV